MTGTPRSQLIIPHPEVLTQKVVWRSEWIQPYESPWGIIEKLKFVNDASENELFSILGNTRNRNKKTKAWSRLDRDLFALSGLDKSLVQTIFGVDLIEQTRYAMIELAGCLSTADKALYGLFRESLAFCPDCISVGYHSIFHQFKLIDYCPFHMTPLNVGCPECGTKMPYEISSTYTKRPFECLCEYSFLDENRKRTFIRTWESKPWSEIQSEEMRAWLSLDEQQQTRISNFRIFNESMPSEQDFFLKHILSVLDPAPDEQKVENKNCIAKSSKFIRQIRTSEEKKQTKFHPEHRYRLFQNEIYLSSKGTFSAIARHLRKTLLKKHRSCIRKFIRDYTTGDPVCPYAYAYVLWRKNIEGVDCYWKVDSGWGRRRLFKNRVEFASYQDSSYLDHLYESWCEHLENDGTDESISSTKWIMNRTLGHIVLSHFHNWTTHANQLLNEERFPENLSIDQDKVPFFIIVFPNSTTEAIEFHWWASATEVAKKPMLACPFITD